MYLLNGSLELETPNLWSKLLILAQLAKADIAHVNMNLGIETTG